MPRRAVLRDYVSVQFGFRLMARSINRSTLPLFALAAICCLTGELFAGRSLQAAGTPAEDWLTQAKQAESARDLPRAAECYVHYLKEHPDDAEVNQRLGLVNYLRNRYQDAVPPLQHALKLDQKLWPSALFLGMCLYRLGQFQKAIAPLEQSLQIKPGLPEGNFWLGSTLAALDRKDEAIEKLQKVPADSPVGLEASYLLVRLYRELAERYYLRLEKAAPDSGRVHQLIAENLIWRNRDPEAIAEFRVALSRQPQLQDIHRAIGDIYWQGHELEKARKEYAMELRVTPLSDVANLRLGQYWLVKGDVERGAKYIELAARLNRNLPEANRDLGHIWLVRGDFAKGESFLKTAAQENPDDPLTHRLLADLYNKTNRQDLARKEQALFEKLASPNRKE